MPENFVIETADFVEWLKTMPPNGRYDYIDICGCVVAQYLKAQGLRDIRVWPKEFSYCDNNAGVRIYGDVPPRINAAANYCDTFGDVLKYLEHELEYAR